MPRTVVNPESEKMTINLGVVDLGQIDLLVEDGFYSNRADFVRTAIRSQILQHADQLKGTIQRRMMAVGILRLGRRLLEAEVAAHRHLDVKVVGMLSIAADVSPELARAAIASVEVRGVLRAGDDVKAALDDRTT